MICATCGNELHIDAEACWRCGSNTESGLVRKQERARAREEEEEKWAELRQIDAELGAAYSRYADRDEEGNVIPWVDPDSILSWDDGHDSHDQHIAPIGRRIQIIRKLRKFVGEEPKPAVVPSAIWDLFRRLIFMGIVWIVLILAVIFYFGIVAPAKSRYYGEVSLLEGYGDIALIVELLVGVSVAMVILMLSVRDFGNLKRHLRQRRREALARLREKK